MIKKLKENSIYKVGFKFIKVYNGIRRQDKTQGFIEYEKAAYRYQKLQSQ